MPFVGQAQNPYAAGIVLNRDDLDNAAAYLQSFASNLPATDLAARTMIGNLAVTIRRCQDYEELVRFCDHLIAVAKAARPVPGTLLTRARATARS